MNTSARSWISSAASRSWPARRASASSVSRRVSGSCLADTRCRSLAWTPRRLAGRAAARQCFRARTVHRQHGLRGVSRPEFRGRPDRWGSVAADRRRLRPSGLPPFAAARGARRRPARYWDHGRGGPGAFALFRDDEIDDLYVFLRARAGLPHAVGGRRQESTGRSPTPGGHHRSRSCIRR